MFLLRIKYLFIAVCSLMLFASCSHSEEFEINCVLRALSSPKSKAILTYTSPYSGEKDTLASTRVKNGKFTFNGCVDYPKMCQIEIGQHKLNLFVENKKISVFGSVDFPNDITVEGSDSHKQWSYLLSKERQIDYSRKLTYMEILKAKKNNEEDLISALEEKHNSYGDSLMCYIKESIRQNKNQFASAFYIYYCITNELFTVEELSQDFQKLSNNSLLSSCDYYKFVEDEIALSQGIKENQMAYDFCLPKDDGCISLCDLRCKNVYLYFTATWCDSCSAFTSQLDSVYSSLSEKNFEVIAYYLDHHDIYWKGFLEKDSSKWIVTSDLMYWQSPVTKRYGVREIPYGVLIDSRGVIWKINPTIDELAHCIKNN